MIRINLFSSPEDMFYQNVDPRRRQEVKDSRLVQEDQRAMSNLPQEGYQREFNPNSFKYDQNSAGAPWFKSEVGPWPKRNNR